MINLTLDLALRVNLSFTYHQEPGVCTVICSIYKVSNKISFLLIRKWRLHAKFVHIVYCII